MTNETVEPRAQLRALTGLRFVAAAAVVAFHFVRWRFDSQGILRQILSCGFVAVGLFFVLSGFILVYAHGEMRSDDRNARRDFWRARFARVYPLYVLGMIFGAVVTWWIGWTHARDFDSALGALKLGAVIFMLPGVSHRTMFLFNWAAWSLTSELLFYFLFPFLITPLRILSTRNIILVCIASSLVTWTIPAIYLHVDPDHLGRPLRLGDELVVIGHYVKFFPLMHLHEFLWGMSAGILWKRFRASFLGVSSFMRDLILLACGSFVIVVALLGLSRFYSFLHSGLFAPVFAILIIALASGKSLASRLLALRPMTLLGEASYAIYMLHVPLYLLMDKWLEHRCTANTRCLIYLAVLVAISMAIHFAFERPLRNAIAKRKRESNAPATLLASPS